MSQEIASPNKSHHHKILLTGASGLVGKELLQQLLNSGLKVRAMQHQSPILISHPDLEIVTCDLLDVMQLEDVMEGITHVFHTAALVSYAPQDQKRIGRVNIEGTSNLVNACIDAGITKLLHVSSVAAIGRPRKGEPVTERMNWTEETHNSHYGKSKYLGELEVWRGIGEGLKAVIVNPSLILGGDSWERGSSAIFKSAYNEFNWYTEGIAGFVDVRDVARAMILLMNSEITSQRYILSGENLSFRNVFSSIASGFGKKPPARKVTPFLAALIWRMEKLKSVLTGKKQLLTRETARTAQMKVYYDNRKILQEFPSFQFTRISDTIAHTCEVLKANYHLN